MAKEVPIMILAADSVVKTMLDIEQCGCVKLSRAFFGGPGRWSSWGSDLVLTVEVE